MSVKLPSKTPDKTFTSDAERKKKAPPGIHFLNHRFGNIGCSLEWFVIYSLQVACTCHPKKNSRKIGIRQEINIQQAELKSLITLHSKHCFLNISFLHRNECIIMQNPIIFYSSRGCPPDTGV